MMQSSVEIHLVFIVEEIGMASVFPKLKEMLADSPETMISILYYSHDNHFLFRKEMDIFERHFPSRLYLSCEQLSIDDLVVNQESIEAVINANTVPIMNFFISGSQPFTQITKELLIFLGVKNIIIQEQFFSC